MALVDEFLAGRSFTTKRQTCKSNAKAPVGKTDINGGKSSNSRNLNETKDAKRGHKKSKIGKHLTREGDLRPVLIF